MSITSERCHLAFRKTERDLLNLSSSQEADRVHAFRTSVLRLQTLLEQLIPERSRSQKKLLKLLGQMRKRAGKVRDLDVQLAALRSLKIPQEPRRKTQLTQHLIELRAKHEKKLRKMLAKETVHEIRKRLKRAFREMKLESSRDPLLVARQMLARVGGEQAPWTEDVLHQYRVVVKRARYAAEFAPKSAEAVRFIAHLKRLQDAIGDWHDWLTLTHTASERLGDVNQSSLVAAFHNVTGGKFRRAVAAASPAPALRRQLASVPASEHPRQPGRKSPTVLAVTDSAA
jgi:CHAD domain-containing protein